MKKIFSIIALVFLLSILVACGDTPEEVLQNAEDQIAVTFATGDSATSVTQDLVSLPTSIGDVVITWKSSNTTYLANDGSVTRGESDVAVTLEATLTYEGVTVKVPFELTIKADSLATLVAAFEASYASTLGNVEFEATDDLTLVSTFDGATVTWSSNDTSIITNAGVVTRPANAEGDQTVILTATLTKGLLDEDVEFLVFVPKLELTISERLQQALAVVTAFPVVDGIAANQEFLTTAEDSLGNEYTVVWTSSHPAILSSTGVVTQPTDADVVVTMTASITYETVTETRTVTFNVFKKADTTVYVSTIAEAIAAVEFEDGKFTTTYPFVFDKLTVVAKVTDNYILTDGVDLIVFYSTSVDFQIDKVYEVSGAIQDYYGVYEIVSTSTIPLLATLLAEETPVYPDPEVIADLDTWLNAKPAFVEGAYYQHEYITVTARVHVQTGLGSYDTYLVDPDWTGWNTGVTLVSGTTFATPSLMVYYKSNIDVLRALNGKVITLTVMVQSWRTDKLVWYVNFMGGVEDIEVVLNDQESVDAAEDQIEALIASQYVQSATVALPGELFGATIDWSTSDEITFNSDTGVVTMPAEGLVSVAVTAVITKNAVTKTVVINTNVGAVPLIDISALYDAESTIEVGDFIKIKGLLVAQNSTSSWWLQDDTAGINIYVPSALRTPFAAYQLGIEVEITGKFGLFNGLYQIADFTAQGVVIVNNTPVALPAPKDISNVEFTNAALIDYLGQLVSFEGFVLKDTVTATSGHVNIVLMNPTTGYEIVGFLHSAAKGYVAALAGIKEFVSGDAINVTGAILGWNNNKYQMIITDDHFSAGTDYTEAELAAYAESKLVVPQTDDEVTENLTLPTSGLFGSTVVWTSSNETAITTAGVVTRGVDDAVVTLGYTLTLGGTTLTEKTVNVTVLKEVVVVRDLFISEYIEGSSNNKALEIYNGTGSAVDLSVYKIGLYSNGSSTGLFYQMTGTLASGEVFVIANTQAIATILAEADVTFAYVSGQFGVNWNGNDAVALLKNDVVIDVIGVIGVDPTSTGWAVDVGYTTDYTLVRKSSVITPNAVWTPTEWTAYIKDTVSYLGSHTGD